MVLAELGQRITQALSSLNNVAVVDEAVRKRERRGGQGGWAAASREACTSRAHHTPLTPPPLPSRRRWTPRSRRFAPRCCRPT